MRPSEPEFTPLACTDVRLRVGGRIPSDLAQLEGHFPGHPIVPGFVQVYWALAQSHEHLDTTASVASFEALKFRAPLQPGAPFEMEVASDGGLLRFQIEGGGEVFSSGRMRLDSEVHGHEPEHGPAPHTDDLGRAAPLRIPHAGSMRLLSAVVCHDTASTTCMARLREDVPLRRSDGDVSPCLAIELLAQAMAAHGGLVAHEAAAPRRGFLVSARHIALRTTRFRIGERLWVRADHVRGELGMVAFRCALGTGAIPEDEAEAQRRAVASGSLGALVESDT